MMKKVLLLLTAVSGLFIGKTSAQLTIVNNSNATQLAQLLAGNGVTISNAFKNCPNAALGTFNNGNTTNLGLNSGIVLTTGTVTPVAGPASNFASTDNTNGTDATLNSISNATTQDVCVLEFDIIPQGNVLNFRYVFGSEEYPEYVCSQYNDVFGFFVSGPNPGGGNYTNSNIALIPNSPLSVAIGTVNPGTPGGGYSASGCQSLAYSQYYVNNTGTTIVYDGFTTVLNASLSVVPCQQYHVKLAIGDAGDGVFDSGVFMEANSFVSQSSSITATANSGFTSTFEGCVGGVFTINVPTLATSSTAINYTVSGTATNGVDYTTLTGVTYVNPGTSTALVYVDPLQDNLPEGAETVTITITDPCTGLPVSSATLNINDSPLDTAYASSNFVCQSGQVQLTATGGGTYSWSPPTGLSSTTSATPTANITSDITYTVNINFGNCVEYKSVSINADTVNVNILSSQNGFICPGTQDSLLASVSGGSGNFSYQWSPANQVSNPTNGFVFTSPLVNTTYTVTVTDGLGCTASANYTINVATNLQVSLGPDVNVCPEDVPYVLGLPGGPYTSYTWSNGATTPTISISNTGDYSVTAIGGQCTYTSDTITVTLLTPVNPTLADNFYCSGAQTTLAAAGNLTNVVWNTGATTNVITVNTVGGYYYTADDANGCFVSSDTATVTEVQTPSTNATASVDTICSGGSSVLTSGAVQGLSYNWSNGATTSSTTVNSAGIYYLTVTNGGCPAYDTIQIYQYQFPPVSIGNDVSVCSGEPVTFTPDGGPYVSYNWSNGATSASVTVTAAGTYSVTVNNGTCPLVSNTVNLSNYPGSNPPLADSTLCIGNAVMLTVLPGTFDVLWSNGATTDTIYVTTNGNYSYTGSTLYECAVVSDTATISFVNPPAVNATASPDTICAGSSSTLTANAVGSNLTYLWSQQGNTSSITVSQPGTYYLTVSAGSCINYDTVTVYQYTHAPVVLNNDTIVCPGKSVTVAPSGAPYVTYNWSNGLSTPTITVSAAGDYTVTVNDGHCDYVSDVFTLSNFQPVTPFAYSDTSVCAGQPVILSGEPDFQNIVWSNQQAGVSITVTTAGTYSYTATDGAGCQVTSTSVTVTHRPYPNPNIVATPPAICVGQGSTTLNAGSETGVTYVWQPTGASTPTIQITQPGTYTVQANNNGCIKLDTITVNAADTPTLNLDPLVLSCCQTVVINPAPGQGYTYVWNTGSTDSTLTVTTTNNAVVNYSVTATNSAGCTSTGVTSVIIKCINAVASALPDTVMFGDSSQLNVVTDYVTTFNYSWLPSASLTGATTQNPVAAPLEETAYTVVVTDVEDGCVDTATVTVYVLYGDKIAMPNAFTPNGDGKNDDFYPVLLGPYQQVIEFRIYNRWGAMVHNSTSPWNGEFSSKEQPAGTYVYYIIVRVPDPQNQGSTKDIKLSGSFTLLR